jgi:hypothetical protein
MIAAAAVIVKTTAIDQEVAVQLIALIVIVTGVLFLITAGFKAADIAPALGLLGTIAGYLLGRNRRGAGREKDDEREE